METESTPLKTYEAGVAVVGTPLMSGLILHKEPKTQQSDNGVQFQILGARLCAGPRGCQPLSSPPPPPFPSPPFAHAPPPPHRPATPDLWACS